MIALLVAASASACGPDFPDLLLDDRGRTLLDLPEAMFDSVAERFVPPPADRWVVDEYGDRDAAEREGLTDPQWAEVVAMRAGAGAGTDLPPDVRLYTAGAVAWHHDQVEDALRSWARVLELPLAERHLRGTWAAYMLAEAATGDEWVPAFARVREEVRSGSADPAGLAVASLGEEARRWRWAGDDAVAVHRYAEQASHGSQVGSLSLLFLARDLARSGRWRVAASADPLARDLLVTYAWTHPAELESAVEPQMSADALLWTLDADPRVQGADRMAALAYDRGRYDVAAKWAALAPTPLASWVKAKLALRAGDLDRAARAYQDVVRSFPDDAPEGAPEQRLTRCRLQEERGALALARGEYQEALDVLLDAARLGQDDALLSPPGWEDAAFVAERVLTVDELQAFVDRTAPTGEEPLDARLRALLARRLARSGRALEAGPYFADPVLAQASRDYGEALEAGARGPRVERARALLEAGRLARPGLFLLGTEVAPDFAVFDGDYDRWWDDEPHRVDPRFESPDEFARVTATAPSPDQRFHYRERAADHAVAAAALLPPTTQAYAVALCQAASYVRSRDPERFVALWQRYVSTGPPYEGSGEFGWRCPDPDWDAAERRIRDDRASRLGTVAGSAGLVVVGLGLLALGWARVRKEA